MTVALSGKSSNRTTTVTMARVKFIAKNFYSSPLAEVNAWSEERNDSVVKVHWRFTTDDARIKLKRLYPSLDT